MADLDSLIDMGFDRDKSVLALKAGGNIQGAIEWLDKNADKSIEELTGDGASEVGGTSSLTEEETAQSLVCNECQKRFRSAPQAEFHASKTGHTDFSESTEEIKPMTEEEKAAKLQELRERANSRKAEQSARDKVEQKRNEEIRQKNTKEVADAKEDLAKKEQIKEASAKRREKQADIEAKKRVQAKIQADKEERRRKSELDKAQRENQTFPVAAMDNSHPQTTQTSTSSSTSHSQSRLRLQTAGGSIMKTMPVGSTLFEVAKAVEEEKGVEVQEFRSSFPAKRWTRPDFGVTLKEAGLVPSAVLMIS